MLLRLQIFMPNKHRIRESTEVSVKVIAQLSGMTGKNRDRAAFIRRVPTLIPATSQFTGPAQSSAFALHYLYLY